VRERVTALDELVVPNVGTMQLEGDERQRHRIGGRNRRRRDAHPRTDRAGAYTFNAAYLDAIDARTGKPTRFSAIRVRVVVEGAGVSYPRPPPGLARTSARS